MIGYTSEELGHVFEAVVGSQLVRLGLPLYYWRDGKNEVDFVLKNGRSVYAIEVKSAKKKKQSGMAAFKKLNPKSLCLFIDQENYCEFEHNPLKFIKGHAV